jgi:general stress protein 26
MSKTPQQRMDELIEEFSTAMLVTTSLEGELRARPMAIAGHSRGGLLHFATRSEDEKLEEILKQPAVAVTMQGGDRYLSITGRARIDNRRALAHELWSSEMKIWCPDGPDDPNLTVIAVEPLYAEYWDRVGLRQLEFLWEAGKALARGEKADDSQLGGHAKVEPQ